MKARPEFSGLRFEPATPTRLSDVVKLLVAVGLPADDLTPTQLDGFELAIDTEDRVVGVAGLEVLESGALLRSVAVAPPWRGKGLGETLVARREAAARAAGVGTIYLLTTTADAFFRRLGYLDVARDAVPAAVAGHVQFRSICPASAKCQGKRLL